MKDCIYSSSRRSCGFRIAPVAQSVCSLNQSRCKAIDNRLQFDVDLWTNVNQSKANKSLVESSVNMFIKWATVLSYFTALKAYATVHGVSYHRSIHNICSRLRMFSYRLGRCSDHEAATAVIWRRKSFHCSSSLKQHKHNDTGA